MTTPSSFSHPHHKHDDHSEALALWSAAKRGDVEALKAAIKAGEHINAMDRKHYNRTALHYACQKGRIEAVSFLLSKAADPDMEDNQGKTPAEYAAHFNHANIVQLIDSIAHEHLTMDLDTAIRSGSLVSFRTHMSRIDDPDEKDEMGWTFLMRVSMFNFPDLADFLISIGADVHATEVYGTNSLMFAARQDNKDVAEVLIREGARVNDQNKYGTTALMFAAENGHKRVVKYLLSVGADVDMKTMNGETALSRSSIHAHTSEIAEMLLDFKAALGRSSMDSMISSDTMDTLDSAKLALKEKKKQNRIDIKAHHYLTNLGTVCCTPTNNGGGYEEFRFIISKCDLPDEHRPRSFVDKQGMTFLMHAAQVNNYHIVDELLRCPFLDALADINSQDMLGRTALFHAVENDHMPVVRLMIQMGADVTITDIKGRMALDVSKNDKIKRLLEVQDEIRRKKNGVSI